jgi:hypothetical protein
MKYLFIYSLSNQFADKKFEIKNFKNIHFIELSPWLKEKKTEF